MQKYRLNNFLRFSKRGELALDHEKPISDRHERPKNFFSQKLCLRLNFRLTWTVWKAENGFTNLKWPTKCSSKDIYLRHKLNLLKRDFSGAAVAQIQLGPCNLPKILGCSVRIRALDFSKSDPGITSIEYTISLDLL